MRSPRPAAWRFAEFELDPSEDVLRKDGQAVRLGHQPLRALTLLVSRAGELVTREELRDHIWGDRVNVDFEHGLNVCIRQIRTALGEQADSARIILTVPRVGYRLNVAVSQGRPKGRVTSALRLAMTAAAAVAGLAVGTYSVVQWGAHRPTPRRDALDFPAVFERGNSAATIPVGIDFGRPGNPRKPEASAFFWRGRAAYDSDSGGNTTEGTALIALRYFQRAVSVDPSFAQAHAGVAIASTDLATFGIDARASAQLANESASRALQLDASIPESHIAAAEVMHRLRGDWIGADHEYQRALAIAPDDAFGHLRYAFFLREERRFDAALDHLNTAHKLDPLGAVIEREIARTYYFERQYDDCIDYARRTLDLDPNYLGAYQTLGQCFEVKGHTEEAVDAYQHGGRVALGSLGHVYAHCGRQTEARQLANALSAEQPRETGVSIALIYNGLGDRDAAVSWLRRTYDGGRKLPFGLRVASHWDWLRTDNRFAALLQSEAVVGR